MFCIDMVWPNWDLSPNGRIHWKAKIDLAKEAKFEGRLVAMSQFPDPPQIPKRDILLYVVAHPPNKETDSDNLLAALKYYIDGVALHFGFDDKLIRMPIVDWGEIEKPGRCMLYFLPGEAILEVRALMRRFIDGKV